MQHTHVYMFCIKIILKHPHDYYNIRIEYGISYIAICNNFLVEAERILDLLLYVFHVPVIFQVRSRDGLQPELANHMVRSRTE